MKPATQVVWSHAIRNLKAHFGADRDVATITEGDADGFKLFLISQKLAAATLHKRLQNARSLFKAALRQKLIPSNPFADVSAKNGAGTDRQFFVTREATERVLAVCDPTWRVVVALARYGGLRCPSEVLSVKWTDIDWQAGRLVVTSPKTAHHEGKGSRVIPLYPELRAILDEAYELAAVGAEYVVSEFQKGQTWHGCNLRNRFERIIKRAGLTPWPRLFQNLRATRETELSREYPIHVVTAWMGNTPNVALRHYLMTTDSDFERAAKSAAVPIGGTPQDPANTKSDGRENPSFAGSREIVRGGAQVYDGSKRTRPCP